MPPAAGRFSTTTGCFSRSCSFSAISRPVASTPPPAPIGTTMVIWRPGLSCACAVADSKSIGSISQSLRM